MKRNGFTLIEILVVVSLVGVIGVMVVSILAISFRGSYKAEVLATVRQNGNFALSQMAKQIRYAKTLDVPASCTTTTTASSITITSFSDNRQTTFACPGGANTTIASNGASLLDTTAVSISSCSFTCTQQNSFSPQTIRIEFVLSAREATQLEETQASIPFQTSVTLRNYNR